MYAEAPGSRSAFFNHFPERKVDLVNGRFDRSFARVEHDIPLRPDFGTMHAERFSQTPFDPVANHRATDRSRNRKSKTSAGSVTFCVREAKRREQGSGEAHAVVIYRSEIGGAQNP